MIKPRYSQDVINRKLAQVENLRESKGYSISQACRYLGISEPSYYRWKSTKLAGDPGETIEVSKSEFEYMKQKLFDLMLENQRLRDRKK